MLMKTSFTKMSGAGNDFVVIDNRSNAIADACAFAKRACDRRWGVGADGLLLIENSTKADYRMMYYNADGSYGGMCGNGGRCISYLAHAKNISQKKHRFEALGHIYEAEIDGALVNLLMRDPVALRRNVLLQKSPGRIIGHYIDTGSPHVVIPFPQLRKLFQNLESVPVEGLGRKFRHNRHFYPNGANINFVEKVGAKTLRIRTYERGVEGETLACGTGAIASAIVGSLVWKMSPPITIVPASSVNLTVSFDRIAETICRVRLEGPVEVTFEGEINV